VAICAICLVGVAGNNCTAECPNGAEYPCNYQGDCKQEGKHGAKCECYAGARSEKPGEVGIRASTLARGFTELQDKRSSKLVCRRLSRLQLHHRMPWRRSVAVQQSRKLRGGRDVYLPGRLAGPHVRHRVPRRLADPLQRTWHLPERRNLSVQRDVPRGRLLHGVPVALWSPVRRARPLSGQGGFGFRV